MIATPRCVERKCVHFEGIYAPDPNSERGQRPRCAAFPRGIPNEIAYGNDLHADPFPGDHGVQYKREK